MARRICQEIPLGPRAAARARAALKRLEREVPREVLDDVRLLVSELVTNSYRHAAGHRGTATLAVKVDRERVHVEVADDGVGFEPTLPKKASPDRASGWGLTIVDRIADRWGVSREDGTHVWFELMTNGRGIPAQSA